MNIFLFSKFHLHTGEYFSRTSFHGDVFLTVAGLLGVLIVLFWIKLVLQMNKRKKNRNTDTVPIKDTEDVSDASGPEPNSRIDHRALMAKQTDYGSTPARDYMEHMVEEEEGVEDDVNDIIVIIVLVVLVLLAFMFL